MATRAARWYVAALGVIATLLLLRSMSVHGFAGDLLMDIANGRWILAHGRVPLHNHLTQAMRGRPWADPEWLFGVLVAWLYGHFGRLGVFWGLAPVMGVTGLFVAVFAARAGRPWGFLLTMLGAAALTTTANPRPQMFSYACFAFGLWAVLEYRKGRRWPVWAFTLLVPVWANAHASVVLAPALLLSEAVMGEKERLRGLVLPTLLSAGLSFAHPGGAHLSGVFLNEIFSPGILGTIQEWMSPNFHAFIGLITLPWLFFSLAFLAPTAWRRGDMAGAVWAVAGPFMTLFAVRFTPYMVLGALALAGEYWPERWRHDVPYLPAVAAVGMAALLSAATVATAAMGRTFPVREPVAAIEYLKRHGATDVLPFYTFGDALAFYGVRPFADGAAELWAGTSWWLPYVRAQSGRTDIGVFARRWDPGARWILWPTAGYGGSQPLHLAGWRLVFRGRRGTGGVGAGVWERGAP